VVDDPGNPQTLNRYAYAANNPLSNVDPTGHIVGYLAIPGLPANLWAAFCPRGQVRGRTAA
jgi:hypothetical protein